jgi:hypothetical protein
MPLLDEEDENDDELLLEDEELEEGVAGCVQPRQRTTRLQEPLPTSVLLGGLQPANTKHLNLYANGSPEATSKYCFFILM